MKTRSLGKRLLSLALSLISVLILTLPAAAVETGEAAEVFYTTQIHHTASHSSSYIGQLENGTAVNILLERGNFYQIDCYDMNGYIAKTQVELREDGKYYVNCDPACEDTKTIEYVSMADALQLRSSLLSLAQEQLGSRYVYGSSRPGAFDCSGLTYYLYGKHDMPISRTASTQMQDGLIVSSDGMQVGDLVFFREPGYPKLSSHVGLYIGDGKMIHASHKGIVVSDFEEDYYMDTFLCARRIVNVSTAQVETVPAVTARSASLNIRTMGLRTVD